MKKVAKTFKILAAMVGIHCICLFLLLAVAGSIRSELVALAHFWVFVVPALVLTMPFQSIFWKLHLVDTRSAWFASPSPMAIVLSYIVWIFLLLLVACFFQMCQKKLIDQNLDAR